MNPWRRKWQPTPVFTPVFLPGKSPWTEEPGGLQSTGLQGCTWLRTKQQQHNKNLASIHPQMKLPLWELWDLITSAKGPKGVSPTCASGNRLTDLSPSCGPCCSLWTSSSPLGGRPEHLENTGSRQLPTGTREPLWNQGFQRRSYSTLLEKKNKIKYEFGWIGVGEKKNLTLPISPLPWEAQLQPKWDPSGLRFLPWEKGDLVNECETCPVVWDFAKETHFSLPACVFECAVASVLSSSLRPHGL